MNKSYYKGDVYIDTTTGNEYYPKTYCEICGSRYFLTVHHKLEQQKCLRDLEAKKIKFPNMFTKEFIQENQKLFTMCLDCHTDIHNLSDERFLKKYGKERSMYLYKSS